MWPAIINLGVLCYVRLFAGWQMSGVIFAVFVLAIVNGIAATLMAAFKKKLAYVPAFLLAGLLLLLLIGLSVCATIVLSTKKPILNL